MTALQRAREFYRQQRAVSILAVRAARTQVRQHPGDVAGLTRTLSRYQLASARLASLSMAKEAGRAPVAVAQAFAGHTALGVPLDLPVRRLLDDLAAEFGAATSGLTLTMLDRIDRMVASEVADAGRGAAGVEIVAEPLWTNYVRVLNPPSCSRCAILAGRIYRDNEGFLRHPLCDCVHWPVQSWEQAHDEGLVFSARDAFDRGLIRGLSAADTRAVANGADPAQVVNAAQGMHTASIFGRHSIKATSAGTTKRSEWRRNNPDRPIRLRPESISDLATDREDELRLLRLYGYLKDDTSTGRTPIRPRRPAGGGRGDGSGEPPRSPAPAPGPDQPPMGPVLGTPDQQKYVKNGTPPPRYFTPTGNVHPGNDANNHFAYVPDPEDRATALLQYFKPGEHLVKQIARERHEGRPLSTDTEQLIDEFLTELHSATSTEVTPANYSRNDLLADLEGAAQRLLARPVQPLGLVHRGVALNDIDMLDVDFLDQVKAAIETTDWWFASASPKMFVAERYAGSRDGASVIIEIRDAHGVILESMGRMSTGPEVLISGQITDLTYYQVGNWIKVEARWAP